MSQPNIYLEADTSAKEDKSEGWNEELSLILIKEFEARPDLWDPTRHFYFNRLTRCDTWRETAEAVGRTEEACKAKIRLLMAALRQEKAKMVHFLDSQPNTGQPKKPFKSKWFAFEALSFLSTIKNRQRDPAWTYHVQNEENFEVIRPVQKYMPPPQKKMQGEKIPDFSIESDVVEITPGIDMIEVDSCDSSDSRSSTEATCWGMHEYTHSTKYAIPGKKAKAKNLLQSRNEENFKVIRSVQKYLPPSRKKIKLEKEPDCSLESDIDEIKPGVDVIEVDSSDSCLSTDAACSSTHKYTHSTNASPGTSSTANAKEVMKRGKDEDPCSSSKNTADTSAKPNKNEEDDDIAAFTNFIAVKMRKYSPKARSAVQRDISNIIFRADQNYYEDN